MLNKCNDFELTICFDRNHLVLKNDYKNNFLNHELDV